METKICYCKNCKKFYLDGEIISYEKMRHYRDMSVDPLLKKLLAPVGFYHFTCEECSGDKDSPSPLL